MKHIRLLTLMIVAAIILVACGGAPTPEATEGAPVTGETPEAETGEVTPTRTTLIIASKDIPEILDGQQMNTSSPLTNQLIGQPLICYDSVAGVFVPDLVESFTISEDGSVMTLKLPTGYQFSNGKPLNAQALADTIERYRAISPYNYDYDGLEAVKVIDETTLEIVNPRGFNVMNPTFMTAYGAAWDVKAAKEIGDEAFAANPVGSGIFKINTKWAPGQDLELVRNDNYRTNNPLVENKGPAHIENVRMRFIQDAQTRANELEAGSVDIVYGLSASAVASMRNNPDIQIYEQIIPGQNNLSMNNSRPPFNNINVRKAVAMAINREEIITALNGSVTAEYAYIPSAMIAYDPTAQEYARTKYPFDIEAAKALLAEAGWKDTDGDGIVEKDGKPFSVEMLVSSESAIQSDAAPVVQAQLKAIGIDAQIALQTNAYIRDTMRAAKHDMGFSFYKWADPDILTYRFTEGNSRDGFAPPELAKMLDEARFITNPAARTAAYLEIQKYLIDNTPQVPLMNEIVYIGARSWVKGIVTADPSMFFLNDVIIVDEK